MVEILAQTLIDKEGLSVSFGLDRSTARCPHPYCPSSIIGDSIKIEDVRYFYLFHIPHFHKSTIYPANPSQLSPFLQTTLLTHSGLGYLNDCISHLSSNSPSSTTLLPILQTKRNELIEEWKKSLRYSAVNEFGQDVNEHIMKLTDIIDGRRIYKFV